MATLVNKIKTKIHRRSGSGNYDTLSHDQHDTTIDGATSDSMHNRSPSTAALDNSAFHVTRGGGVRKSLDNPVDRYQSAYADANVAHNNKRRVSIGNFRARPGQDYPERSSSKHQRHISQEEQQAMVDETIPPRESSRNAATTTPGRSRQEQVIQSHDAMPDQRSSRHGMSATPNADSIGQRSPRVNGEHDPASITSGTGRSGSRGVPRKALPKLPGAEAVYPHQQSQPASRGSQTLLAQHAQVANQYLEKDKAEQAKTDMLAAGHMQLPPGFSMYNTEETHISEEQRPAVTYETIVHQKTEIIQEEITRDIHVHHYYTYLQPVKVVEVLPPKHFLLDIATGTKTEIPEPVGWRLPVSMAPVLHDTGMVSGWTRHYLVDEEHPTGVPEVPEPSSLLKHEQAHKNLRKEAIAQRN